MCAMDRRETPRNSQSVNKYILSVQNIYRNSPVPVCVRNKKRKILYANGAFIELFSKEDKPLSGESYVRLQVEIFLSSLELECQSLGHGSAFCRRFNFHGEIYQIRMENVLFYNEESVVLWQINPFPDYPFFSSYKKNYYPVDNYVRSVLSNMTAKSLVVFCFYTLGYKHINIAKELEITEIASKKRVKKINADINKRLGCFDLFRSRCITTGVMYEILSIVSEFMGVKKM
ncbi:PAS domain-containing protein [Salmonella enterica]|nr:PAS domain-containing protein [Salmonella enterica subsp. enterica serovar Java]EAP0945805.1 PAS domain-containing protein [Salmonella enterica]EBI0041141.1 PAS domain-containing protein [Salmonella enterica subsp. diarizonae serovar 61:k:z35]ECD9254324.1 PAS domain-containing protein [Salmonella enterica subsp. diarizonae]ECT8549812.1 PAS domain-containing protein [Salmonella enterica subsp. diarizonae serovar 48:i:z]EIC4421537.1 PAS domain-containing protein [Salmonella enterica subsp. en